MTVFIIQVESRVHVTVFRMPREKEGKQKTKGAPVPVAQSCRSSWEPMRSTVHRLRRLCVQPSKGTWKPASAMNRFSGRWVCILLSRFSSAVTGLGSLSRSTGPRTPQARNYQGRPLCIPAWTKPKGESGTKGLLNTSAYLLLPRNLPTPVFPAACLFSHHLTSRVANPLLLPLYVWTAQLKSTTFEHLVMYVIIKLWCYTSVTNIILDISYITIFKKHDLCHHCRTSLPSIPAIPLTLQVKVPLLGQPMCPSSGQTHPRLPSHLEWGQHIHSFIKSLMTCLFWD